MSAPVALNSQNYAGLDTGIQDILKQGKRALITIYTAADGSAIASDAHGNIENREILSISYTASYKDADGNDTNPFVVIKFANGNGEFIDYFTTVDYVDDHWYALSSKDIPAKTF